MYQIINQKDGAIIGSTEQPRFIKKSSAGCYIQSDEANAQGIAHQGIAYNLQGRIGVGAEDTCMLIEHDAGCRVDEIETKINEQKIAVDSLVISMLEGEENVEEVETDV
mgnify:CR=1 FL=1